MSASRPYGPLVLFEILKALQKCSLLSLYLDESNSGPYLVSGPLVVGCLLPLLRDQICICLIANIYALQIERFLEDWIPDCMIKFAYQNAPNVAQLFDDVLEIMS